MAPSPKASQLPTIHGIGDVFSCLGGDPDFGPGSLTVVTLPHRVVWRIHQRSDLYKLIWMTFLRHAQRSALVNVKIETVSHLSLYPCSQDMLAINWP